jgi:hypothetical protein
MCEHIYTCNDASNGQKVKKKSLNNLCGLK